MDKKSESFKVSAVRREARGMQGSSNNSVTAIPRMQVIQTYMKMTSESYRKQKILNVWEVDREAEVI